jgi:hypothetical protein
MTRPPVFFNVGDRLLQVAAVQESDGWAVRIYDDKGRRVSPIVYRVDYETVADAAMGGVQLDLVDNLMKLLKDEAETGRLKLLPAAR